MNINLVPLTILILLVSQAIQLQKKRHFVVKTNNRNGKGKHCLIKTVANRGETTSIADKDYKLSSDDKGQTPSIADKDVEQSDNKDEIDTKPLDETEVKQKNKLLPILALLAPKHVQAKEFEIDIPPSLKRWKKKKGINEAEDSWWSKCNGQKVVKFEPDASDGSESVPMTGTGGSDEMEGDEMEGDEMEGDEMEGDESY